MKTERRSTEDAVEGDPKAVDEAIRRSGEGLYDSVPSVGEDGIEIHPEQIDTGPDVPKQPAEEAGTGEDEDIRIGRKPSVLTEDDETV